MRTVPDPKTKHYKRMMDLLTSRMYSSDIINIIIHHQNSNYK